MKLCHNCVKVAFCMCVLFNPKCFAQQDSGIPASKAKDFEHQNTDTTGSEWRTYKNAKTDQTISFNPKHEEVWFNPVSKKYEVVIREDNTANGTKINSQIKGPNSDYLKNEVQFNPKTKKFETKIVDLTVNSASAANSKEKDILTMNSQFQDWVEITTGNTTSIRTYKNSSTGAIIYDSQRDNVAFNSATAMWETVIKEAFNQSKVLSPTTSLEKPKPYNPSSYVPTQVYRQDSFIDNSYKGHRAPARPFYRVHVND